MKWLQLLLQGYIKYKQGRALIPTNIGLVIALFVSIIIILASVMFSVPIGYALVLVWLCLAYALYRQGYNPKDLLRMSWTSAKSSIVVMQIFLLIGWLTAMWQASGIIPMIIASGIELINPNLFIIYAFLITSCVSMLLGTSLGTVGTIGIVLITIAKAGNLPIDMVAGAIIAGAYVGDRNSPLSSSASLVAALTHTKVNSNIPIMFRDSIPALIISCILYVLLSLWFPLDYTNNYLPDTIHLIFNIHWTLWIPVLIVIGLLPTRLSIRWPIGISALSAAILAVIHQNYTVLEILQFSVTGFKLPDYNPLANIIHGGGLKTMWVPTLSIFMACSISGMLEGVGFWNDIRNLLQRVSTHAKLFASNVLIAVITGALGCSQAIAVVMTHSIMRTTYAKERIQDEDVMLDFENSGILIAALQPWNIAALVPVIMMDVSPAGYIPFAFFLYLAPIIYWYRLRRREQQIQ